MVFFSLLLLLQLQPGVGQQLFGSGALVGIPFECSLEEVHHVLGQVFGDFSGESRAVSNFVDCGPHGVALRPRGLSGDHLDDGAADRPYI